MPVPQDDIRFDYTSSRYRRRGSGRFLSGGPKDYDDDANRFRAKNGRFKDQSAYGADDVRDSNSSQEFLAPGRGSSEMGMGTGGGVQSGGSDEVGAVFDVEFGPLESNSSLDDGMEMRFDDL